MLINPKPTHKAELGVLVEIVESVGKLGFEYNKKNYERQTYFVRQSYML